MNRRKFFAALPAAVLAPVAAHGAGTERNADTGVYLPDSVNFVGQEEFSKLMRAARQSRARVAYRRYLNETMSDNWVRRDGIIDMLCVDGRVVAMRVSPTALRT